MDNNFERALPPSLLRRFAAIFYDLLLVTGMLMLGTALVTIPVDLALGQEASSNLGKNMLFRLWLLSIPCIFFVGFWRLGGQTLGMRAWRLKMVSLTSEKISWGQAFIHFFASILSWIPLGAGFFWSLVDTKKRTWHDKLSNTQLVMITKKQ